MSTYNNENDLNENNLSEEPAPKESKIKNFLVKKIGKLPVWLIVTVCLLVVIGSILIIGIKHAESRNNTGEVVVEAKAVKVTQFSETGSDAVLHYIGTVQPEETQQATYAGISEVKSIYVSVGDSVKKGSALAMVDPGNAESVVRNSETVLNEAKSAQSTAQVNYNNALNQQTRYKELVAIKAAYDAYETAKYNKDNAPPEATQDELDALTQVYNAKKAAYDIYGYGDDPTPWQDELTDYTDIAFSNGYPRSRAGEYYDNQVRITKAALDEANSAVSNAQTNYDENATSLDKCTIYSELNGYVIGIYTQAGEVATPLMPIVVVGSNSSKVVVGVSASDIRDVSVGQACEITVNGTTHEGEVTEIATMPDTESRTYNVSISLPQSENRYLIGDIASVKIHVGEKLGVWLPISIILNDGEDYVYVIEDNRAMKRYIRITDISNDYVCVTGLEGGGYVVTEGMKSLKSGNLVNIVD